MRFHSSLLSLSCFLTSTLVVEALVCHVRVAISRGIDEFGGSMEAVRYSCAPVSEGGTNVMVYHLPDQVVIGLETELRSGTRLMEITGATLVSNDDGDRVVLDEATATWMLLEEHHQRRLNLAGTTGNRTALMVRVFGNNEGHPIPKEMISNAAFGETGYTAQAVYSDCSHEKLRFQPATNNADISVDIEDGVFDLEINQDWSKINDSGRMENVILIAMMQVFGSQSHWPWDHTVYCFAQPGFSDWTLWAYVNGYDSYLLEEICLYPSAIVHETGHNLGLQHSFEDLEVYGDETCLMGYSYPESDGPKKCFNGHKHWILGWVNDRRITLDASTAWRGLLVAFTSYETSTESQYVVINVLDLYIQFNHAVSFNSGVNEYPDQVTIVQAEDDNDFSHLLGHLGNEGSFEYQEIKVEVCSIDGEYVDLTVYPLGQESGCTSLSEPDRGDSTRQCKLPGEICSHFSECCTGRCSGSCRDVEPRMSSAKTEKARGKLAKGLGGGGGRKRVRGRRN